MKRRRRSPSTDRSGLKSGDLILVVCEGSECEPRYFEHLRRAWRLQGLEVCGSECGSDPLSVVTFAAQRMEERNRRAKRDIVPKYDQVWCVVDRDNHKNLNDALQKAEARKIRVAISIPCFEVWFLLHFVYASAPFEDCSRVTRALSQHLKGQTYSKSLPPCAQLLTAFEAAICNAERLRQHCKSTNSMNPSTDVDILVRSLWAMKRSPLA